MDTNKQVDPSKKTYHELLMELIKLKNQDYDKFMRKLYEALTGEARDALQSPDPASEKKKALWTMIEYFQTTEEYEKCSELKKMSDSIQD
jgi:hypothetical protein